MTDGSQQVQQDWYSPPGDTISEHLTRARTSLSELSLQLGVSQIDCQLLLEGQFIIDEDLATTLSKVVGGTSTFWLTREEQYREDMHMVNLEFSARGVIEKNLPIKKLQKLGWLDDESTAESIFEFLRIDSPLRWQEQMSTALGQVAFRKTNKFKSDEYATFAWLRKCELDASKIECKEFDPELLQNALGELRRLTRLKHPSKFLAPLRDICAQAGVAVVVNKAPEGCRASGATRLLSGNRALLALTPRYKTDDQFWFSFFHEVGHLVLHQTKFALLEEDQGGLFEQDADDFAQFALIPPQHKEELLSLKSRYKEIMVFARMVGVSVGVVVGQLQHAGILGYNQQNKLKRKLDWSSL